MLDESKIKSITEEDGKLEIVMKPRKPEPHEGIKFFVRAEGIGYKFFDDDGEGYGKVVFYRETDTDDPVEIFARLYRDAMNTLAEIEREKGKQHIL